MLARKLADQLHAVCCNSVWFWVIQSFSPECLHLRYRCSTGATLPDIDQTRCGMRGNLHRIMSSERYRCPIDSKHSLCHLPSSALHTLSKPRSQSFMSSSPCMAYCVCSVQCLCLDRSFPFALHPPGGGRKAATVQETPVLAVCSITCQYLLTQWTDKAGIKL